MKTPKEIEQLAKQLCNIPIDLVIDEEERYYKNLQKFDGIVLGYTQCQEDMADKKYTEDEMRRAYNKGCNTTMAEYEKVVPEHIKPMSFEKFIQSLNKQD